MINVFRTIVFAVIITVLGILGIQTYKSLIEQELKHNSIDNCFRYSTYTYNNQTEGYITTEPLLSNYVLCMREKGYTTVVDSQDK